MIVASRLKKIGRSSSIINASAKEIIPLYLDFSRSGSVSPSSTPDPSGNLRIIAPFLFQWKYA
jgi:hypothetical protein